MAAPRFHSFETLENVGKNSFELRVLLAQRFHLSVLRFDGFYENGNDADIVDTLEALLISRDQLWQNLLHLLREKADLTPLREVHLRMSFLVPIEGNAAQIQKGVERVDERRDIL